MATKPDVAIVDHALPLISGIEVTRQIRLRVPSVEVLIFTMHDSDNLLRDLLEAGARGYVLKSDTGEHLISTVQALAAHKAEVIWRRGPWRSIEAVEYATLAWVDWFNNRRLLEPIGNVPPAEAEAA